MWTVGVWIWLILTIILALSIIGMFLFWILHKVEKIGGKAQTSFFDIFSFHKVKKKVQKDSENADLEAEDLDKELNSLTGENNIETQEEKNEVQSEELWIDKETDAQNGKVEEKQEEKLKSTLERIMFDAWYFKQRWNFEEYEKKIIEWLALSPTHLEFTKMLADYYFVTWVHKKALSLLKKVIEWDDQAHRSFWQIGEIYYLNGDLETSEMIISKAIKLRPENPKYLLSMVEIYYHTDRIDGAITLMEKIVQLRPANTNYLLTLAEFYEKIFDFDSAKKYYSSVLEYEPTHEKAKRKLKTL